MTVTRRMFLRGAGGAALAIPFLPSLLRGGSAEAQLARRPYFLAYLTTHGGITGANMYPADATLTETTMAAEGHHQVRRGALALATSGGTAALSPTLSAPSTVLTPSIASKMNVLRGLDISYAIAHHYCGASLGNLGQNSSDPNPYDRGPRRTIDQVMAWSSAVYPDPSAYQMRSVVYDQNTAVSFMYRDPATRTGITSVEQYWSSVSMFEELFPDLPSMPTPAPRPPIVNLVYESYRRLRDGHRRLSALDRERLDTHMSRIDELERRLGAVAVSCTAPSRPEDNSGLLERGYDGNPAAHVRYYQLYNEVLAAALACGATRIAVLAADAYQQTFSTWPSATWHDDVAHRTTWPADKQDLMIEAQRRFFAEVVLDMATRLESIVEADGKTALDRAFVVWLQEHGAVTHDNFSIPAVTLGSADGYFATGNYCDYRNMARQLEPEGGPPDGSTSERSGPGLLYQQFWANCLQAMGVPHEEWAEPDHPGYSARFTWFPDYSAIRPDTDYSDAVWRTAGDTLPFLSR